MLENSRIFEKKTFIQYILEVCICLTTKKPNKQKMIAETRSCSICRREIPVVDIYQHERLCRGFVGEDSTGALYESSFSQVLEEEPQMLNMFKTKSQRQRESMMDEEKPSPYQSPSKSPDSILRRGDHSILCPKCSEVLELVQVGVHSCDYNGCEFCNEYYPRDMMEMHKDYCYHNPYRRYENPYSQNPKEREAMGIQPSISRPTEQLPEISRQEELITLPDGSRVLRTIIIRPNGYNVEERRIRTPVQANAQPQVRSQPRVVVSQLPAFHTSTQNPAVQASTHQQQSGPRAPQIEPEFRPRPSAGHSAGQPHPEHAHPAGMFVSGLPFMGMGPIVQFNPFDAMFGVGRPYHGYLGDQRSSFVPNRTMEDQFGVFSLFGQNPFDPLLQNRMFGAAVDPFDQLLRDHVNFVRVNRARMFDPTFITIILENGAMDPSMGDEHHRVSKENLDRIPVCKFKRNPETKPGEEEKCPVCLLEFNDDEDVKTLPCKHMYHPSCIDTWLVKNSACPICKRDVAEGLGLNQRSSQNQPQFGQQNNQQVPPPRRPAPGSGPDGFLSMFRGFF